MVWQSYIVKGEQHTLQQVLAAFGYWDFEITTDLLELVWNDKWNAKTFANRDKYRVDEGDHLYLPPKPVVPTPVAPGGASNTLTNMPPPVTIWAGAESGPLQCKDEDVRLAWDQTYGQAGWMVATRFTNFADLAQKLRGELTLPRYVCGNALFGCPIQENQITRLGICAHGNSGGIQIDGGLFKDPESSDLRAYMDPSMLSTLTIGRYKAQFQQILRVLAPGATVLFFCCLSAESDPGVELFKAISLQWKDKAITVVGFRSILYSNAGKQKHEGVGYVGARETHYATHRQDHGTLKRVYDVEKYWNDLTKLPWASERTAHALVARGGQIVKRGEPPNPYGLGPEIDMDDLKVR